MFSYLQDNYGDDDVYNVSVLDLERCARAKKDAVFIFLQLLVTKLLLRPDAIPSSRVFRCAALNSVDIILCCCLILFAYIHEQQKMTRLIKVLSSTNTAVAVAGLEMPNLLQTQKSEEAKDHSWCNDKTMMPLH